MRTSRPSSRDQSVTPLIESAPMDAFAIDRAAIAATSAELLAAVNASSDDRCSALWAADGVLMPPHHPTVQGHEAIVQYFRDLFSRTRCSFTFTSSDIRVAGDIALERVTYHLVRRRCPAGRRGRQRRACVRTSARRIMEAHARHLEQRSVNER